MIQRQLGLGAYPDQTYYDPNRPSWLPYFFDTWDEGVKKYGDIWRFIEQGNTSTINQIPTNPNQNDITKGLETIAPYLLIGGLALVGFKIVKRIVR